MVEGGGGREGELRGRGRVGEEEGGWFGMSVRQQGGAPRGWQLPRYASLLEHQTQGRTRKDVLGSVDGVLRMWCQ